jgi:hypothetical protein
MGTIIRKRDQPRTASKGFLTIRPKVAGIDIGSRQMHVCGPADENGQARLAVFNTTTVDLQACAQWLRELGVESVAMESTGVDVSDCEWIQCLHSCGLLQSCYRPSDAISERRSLVRMKATLVSNQCDWQRRMQKCLDQMNVRVHHAVSDVSGTTGLAIIRAIVAGEGDPMKLAQLRDPRCRNSKQQIAEYLTGHWRQAHLFNLANCLKMCDFLSAEIKKCGQQDKRQELFRMVGADLTTIDGLGVETAETIVSEYGIDLSKFAREKQFIAHLQLAPRQAISGGKPIPKGKRKTTGTRAGRALRMAATGVRKSATALGAYYRRISRSKGANVAVFATARKLGTLIYRLLR